MSISPCLWFESKAEEAARFYTKIFKKSKIGKISRYGEGAPMPAGTVLTVQFWLDGQEFLALNGGPHFKFSEAISFVVPCKTQKDLDTMWTRLSAGGGTGRCGWLKDRFGVSWQIVPAILPRLMADKKRSPRVMAALMQMDKLDIKTLEAAYDEKPARPGKKK